MPRRYPFDMGVQTDHCVVWAQRVLGTIVVSTREVVRMVERSSTRSVDPIVSGPVQLSVPAEPGLSRVVRLAAGGLASLTGFSIDAIEDIKIAVSEVMLTLVEFGNGSPIELDFAARDDAFSVHGRTIVDAFDPDDPALELSRAVLDEVCSEHGRQFADGHAEVWAIVTRTG
jgi:anti-sigma regulatory factor (Ser/Thr protein kinase)